MPTNVYNIKPEGLWANFFKFLFYIIVVTTFILIAIWIISPETLTGLTGGITGYIDGFFAWIGGGASSFYNRLLDFFSGILSSITGLFQGIIDWIIDQLPDIGF